MGVFMSDYPQAYLRNHSSELYRVFCAYCLFSSSGSIECTSGFADDVFFYNWSNGVVTLPQQYHWSSRWRCCLGHFKTYL